MVKFIIPWFFYMFWAIFRSSSRASELYSFYSFW